MIPADVDAETLAKTLTSSHNLRVSIVVTDLEGGGGEDISSRLLSGQVDVDATADVTRKLSLELLDNDGGISFSPDSPANLALYLDSMIKVIYEVQTPDGWVGIPVFHGPITSLNRDEDTISVTCEGKEIMADVIPKNPLQFNKGSERVEMIKQIMRATGENKFDIPYVRSRTGAKWAVDHEKTYWFGATRMAQVMGYRLYYNGDGTLVLSDEGGTVYTFRAGQGGSVISTPQVTYESNEIKNTVIVKGGTENKQITATAMLPPNHPLSPESLQRNGKKRFLIEIIEEDTIRTQAQARNLAVKTLNSLNNQEISIAFDSIPIPFLEPNDKVRIETDGFEHEFKIRQFSIPLLAGDAMSVGYVRRMKAGSTGRRVSSKAKFTKPPKNKNKAKKRKRKKK